MALDALCLDDNRVSRGANAASVVRSGEVSVTLRVPPGAHIAPVVLPERSLLGLQNDLPPSTSRWRVSPGALGEPSVHVNGDGFALALLRGAVWDHTTEPMYLLRVPQPAVVAPGTEATFTLPVTIVVAGTALDLTCPRTNAPAGVGVACVASFDAAPLRPIAASAGSLERAAPAPLEHALRLPGADHPLPCAAAEAAIADLAPKARSWFLLPALRDDGEPLVLLAFRASAGRWRLLHAGPDPAAWVARLAARSASSIVSAPVAPEPAPVPAPEPAPVPARGLALATPERFGDFVTYDAATAELVKQLRAAAASSLSVLLLGESGTGKELLAAQLHRESGQATGSTSNHRRLEPTTHAVRESLREARAEPRLCSTARLMRAVSPGRHVHATHARTSECDRWFLGGGGLRLG